MRTSSHGAKTEQRAQATGFGVPAAPAAKVALSLQRSAGNRAVARLLARAPAVGAKLPEASDEPSWHPYSPDLLTAIDRQIVRKEAVAVFTCVTPSSTSK